VAKTATYGILLKEHLCSNEIKNENVSMSFQNAF